MFTALNRNFTLRCHSATLSALKDGGFPQAKFTSREP
jgi:hypothetical protein